MTYTTFSYLLLLLSAACLLPVLFVSRRKKFVAFLLVFGFNALFAAYEAYMTLVWSKTVVAPIRVDIFGIMCLLIVINSLTGLFLLFINSDDREVARYTCRTAGLILIGISLNAVFSLLLIKRENRHASQTLDLKKKLEFQTMFQDDRALKYYFGELAADSAGWSGHYAAEPHSHTSLTRLVINTEGKAWLLFHCQVDAECIYARGEDAAFKSKDRAITVNNIKPDIGIEQYSLELKKIADDQLLVSLHSSYQPPNPIVRDGWKASMTNLTFKRTPPPNFPQESPVSNKVQFMGVFSNGYVQKDVLFVVQMWIWRCDKQIFGRYLRQGWRLGSKADFISASPFTADYKGNGSNISFTISPQESFDGRLIGNDFLDGKVLWFGRPLEALMLKKKELIPGFPYQFAPLTDEKTTQRWLEATSFGKMISWQVPASFDPSTW